MRRVIRNNIWETNSSSVHSLSIDDSGMEPSHLPINEYGEILTDFGSFGKHLSYYNSQEDKLSYLITLCYYYAGYDKYRIEDNYVYNCIKDAICEYAGASGIHIINKNEPDIDHQSQPDSFEFSKIVDPYSVESIQQFVFNRYISLKTTCD